MKADMSTIQYVDFETRSDAGPDLDRTNDQALYFDTTLWTVARDLRFPIEDRSQCPAFTYKIGDHGYGEIVIDPSGRRFDSITDYVRFRLTSSPAAENGNKPAVEDHLPYLVALLHAVVLPGCTNARHTGGGLVDLMVTYENFRAKKLGARLRKVATEVNVATPDIVAKDVMKRCAVCDKAEGNTPGPSPSFAAAPVHPTDHRGTAPGSIKSITFTTVAITSFVLT